MINNKYQKIVPFILFIISLILLFKLLKPMITVVLGSALLAYISFPLHKKISRKISNPTVSRILSIAIIVFVISIPFSFLVFEIIKQGNLLYNSLSSDITKGILFGFGCTSADSKLCLLLNQAERFSLEQLSKFGFDRQIENLLPILEQKITRFILKIPLIIAQVFLSLVIAYFIMKDWKNILKKIRYILPVRKKTINKIINEFRDIANTVIYGQLFVAFVQGVIGAIGFYIFGVPFPIFLGVVISFCALIPVIGTAIIWFPASLYLMLVGYFSNDYWNLSKGIGLFLYGLLIISTIDNILLVKIVHAKVKVNPIIVIIGVIGGASMFGVMGIFIGPILLPLLITYFETFKERFI